MSFTLIHIYRIEMLIGSTRSLFRMFPPALLPPVCIPHHIVPGVAVAVFPRWAGRCPVTRVHHGQEASCNYWLHSQFIVTLIRRIRDKNSGRYTECGRWSHSAVTSAPDNTEVAQIRAASLRTSLPTTRGVTRPGETLRTRSSRRLNGAAWWQ